MSHKNDSQPKTRITVVCAWCGKFIRTVDGRGETGVSHGICTACAKKQEQERR